VQFAVREIEILMQLGSKRILHAAGGSTHGDPSAAARHRRDSQALRFEPLGDLRQIRIAQSETLRVFLGRQPAMIIRRPGRLLFGEQLVQFRLLRRGGLERDRHVGDEEIGFDHALIGLG
jgi:hypothetical protein